MRCRPIVLSVALFALLVAACGGGGPARSQDRADPVGGAASSTAPAAVGVGDATPAGSPTSTALRPAGRRGATRPTTSTTATSGGGDATSGPPATDPEPGSGDVQPTATDDGSQGPPGAFARTLLRPQPATAIVIERAAQTGAAISAAAFDRSAGVLTEVTGKSVDLRPQASLASDDKDWTAEEVRRAADAAARVPQGGGRAVLRVLVLRGRFDGSEDVLGVVVRGDVLALFVDNIAGARTPLVGRQAIEDAVLLHELGHVLGLVDLARDTGRADKEHPGHSSNSASVMYWAVESSLIGQVIGGPPPRDFDDRDLADLRALRNGA